VLGEALSAREVPSSGGGAAIAPEHSIVKIVKPLPILAESAVATAPFVLPRIPFKVNQYWTFQSGAGDSPTFPAVAFQLYTIEAYQDFIRLLEKVAPNQAKNFPLDAAAAINGRSLQRLMRDIRDLFESDPSIESKMLEELERGYSSTGDGKKHALLKSLIKLYGGSNRRYVNYYGPPHTVTTIPFYRGLQLGEMGAGEKDRPQEKPSLSGFRKNTGGKKRQFLHGFFTGQWGFHRRGGNRRNRVLEHAGRSTRQSNRLAILSSADRSLGRRYRRHLPHLFDHHRRGKRCGFEHRLFRRRRISV
jgi:hypothetical protein